MKFLEKDLEDIIWESDNEKLEEKGLDISGKKFRQLRIGNYGISDIVTVSKDSYYNGFRDMPFLNITVYELKKEKVGVSAFFQAVQYCKGIKTYLEKRKPRITYALNIVLCAKEVDTTGSLIFLTDLLNTYSDPSNCIQKFSMYSFDYTIDGIEFKDHSDYNFINKGF